MTEVTTMKNEKRMFDCEIRAEQIPGCGRLEGRAILYNSRTTIAQRFDEIILPGAIKEPALKDVPFFVNHNTDMIPLARSRNNNENSTMQLFLDDEGLGFRIDLDIENNAEARALYSAVERGDISGMSFMMLGIKDRWEGARSGHPLRYIESIGQIGELSAVNHPAYTQTSIESRDNFGTLDSALESLDSAIAEEEAEEREKLANERRMAALERLEKNQKEVRDHEV